MKTLFKTIIAGVIGAITLAAVSTASATDRRPDYCAIDHDHRSHSSNYYDYYDQDRYSRAGAYRNSGVSFSITFGNDGYDNDRYRNDRYRDRQHRRNRHSDDRYRDDNYRRGNRNGYRGRDGRVIKRQIFNTRQNARIILTEEVVRSRRGPRLICTVEARGRDAHHVSERRMRRIANNNCSSRARIKIYA